MKYIRLKLYGTAFEDKPLICSLTAVEVESYPNITLIRIEANNGTLSLTMPVKDIDCANRVLDKIMASDSISLDMRACIFYDIMDDEEVMEMLEYNSRGTEAMSEIKERAAERGMSVDNYCNAIYSAMPTLLKDGYKDAVDCVTTNWDKIKDLY